MPEYIRLELGKVTSCYKVCEQIGEGATSSVYSAKKRGETEIVWAVKVVNIRSNGQTDRGAGAEQIANEIKIWDHVGQHKNTVRCHEVFEEASRFCFVMDRCDGCVVDYIWRAKAVNEKTLACVFAQMLAAIAHVHSVGVAHRDIKPENFLHSAGTVKLSDFGLSLLVPARSVSKSLRGESDAYVLPGVAGTAPFMSPEMVSGNGHGLLTDVWSFGAMAYVMLLGHFPYHPHDFAAANVKVAIAQGSPLPSFEPCGALRADPHLLQPFGHVRRTGAGGCARISPTATSFLRSLLQRDPCRRVDAQGALRDPFLTCTAQGLREPPCLRDTFRMAMCAGAFSLLDVSEHKRRPTVAPSDVSTNTGGSV